MSSQFGSDINLHAEGGGGVGEPGAGAADAVTHIPRAAQRRLCALDIRVRGQQRGKQWNGLILQYKSISELNILFWKSAGVACCVLCGGWRAPRSL